MSASAQEQPETKQKILFLGGVGRSGSTLVEKILNEIPSMFSVGETVHLWERGVINNELCGCNQPFNCCPHWTAVGEEAFNGWENLDVERVIELRWKIDRSRRLPQIAKAQRTKKLSEEQAEYLGYMRSILLASAKVSGKKVLLESSKHLSTAALLSLDPALDVHILHLVRDPRGVAYSWTKQVQRPETDGQDMPTYSPMRSAGRWLTDNAGFTIFNKSQKSLLLRYEDFIKNPFEHVTKICALSNLDIKKEELEFLKEPSLDLQETMHSTAGNPMRFKKGTLTVRKDTAWEEKLSSRDRKIVTVITMPLAYRYGYKK